MNPLESDQSVDLPMKDDWLEASEARYDTMKTLLQSVRQDIDALTTRIDRTRYSPPREPVKRNDGVHGSKHSIDLAQSDPQSRRSTDPSFPGADSRLCCPDLLANVHTLESMENLKESDEFMDIKIAERKQQQHMVDTEADGQLLDCIIVGEAGGTQTKTWRSPSDFNIYNPFREDVQNDELQKSFQPNSHSSHLNEAIKETDLDDLPSDTFEKEEESDGSLSPAVSPTFENYTTENFSLNNMIVTSDDSGHFSFETQADLKRANTPEMYEVYGNGHELTTIDEASEEIDDEWSSSELDTSASNSESARQNEAGLSADRGPSGSNETEEPEKSIQVEFKSSHDHTLTPLTVNTDDQPMQPTDEKRRRPDSDEKAMDQNHTFIFDSSDIRAAEPGQNSSHVIILRPRREENDSTRSMSMSNFRANTRIPDSMIHSDSMPSVFSTISQESMISEADSYVTVGSRFGTTGSDDMYATACSDSELPGPGFNYRAEDGLNLTLSRKRVRHSRNHRARTAVTHSSSSSSSDENIGETTLTHTPEAIVVIPKFSRLPTKIASPNDTRSHELGRDLGRLPGVSMTPALSSASAQRMTQSQTESTSVRKGPHIGQNPHAPYDGESDEPTSDIDKSSGESSSAEGAEYDSSRGIIWPVFDEPSENGVLLPNLIYKPSYRLADESSNRLSVIEEGRSNSSTNEQTSDVDDSRALPVTITLHTTSGDSTDQAEVVVPKYTFSRDVTERPTQEKPDKSSGRATQETPIRHVDPPLADSRQPISAESGTDDSTRIGQPAVNRKPSPVPLHTREAPTQASQAQTPSAADDSSHGRQTVDHAGLTSSEETRKVTTTNNETDPGEKMIEMDADLYENADTAYRNNPYYNRHSLMQKDDKCFLKKENPTCFRYSNGDRGVPPVPVNTTRTENAGRNPSDPGSDIEQRLRAHDTRDVQVFGRATTDGAYRASHYENRVIAEPAVIGVSQREHDVHHQYRFGDPTQTMSLSGHELYSTRTQRGPQDSFASDASRTVLTNKIGASAVHTNQAESPTTGVLGTDSNPMRNDDIQVASQRTSRIIDSGNKLIPASVKLVGAPQASSYMKHPENGDVLIRDDQRSEPTPNTSVPAHSSRAMPLSSEPKPVPLTQVTTASSVHRPRSPSPPRKDLGRLPTRSSPPLIRPKWHLKPIPTDNEIRERLRSRSRKRAEERQSREAKSGLVSSQRPRSSRSESRYRYTDLDSAIAEFKTETLDIGPSAARESEGLSETRQSASLFDLDVDHARKPTSPSPLFPEGIDYHTRVLDGANRKFADAKSYNSLLETDIDTGENFERTVLLETDVDVSAADVKTQKTRSLFNLTTPYTPATYRRQTTAHTSQLDTDVNNWERTKSLQGLTAPRPDGKGLTEARDYLPMDRPSATGAKGLIDRLRDKAKSTHELRIAQSLTKLKVPEWLDKAECLSRSVTEGRAKDHDDESYVPKYRMYSLTKTASTREPFFDRTRPFVSSVRSLSGVRKPGESMTANWLPKTQTSIETVAEPARPKAIISQQPQFTRPSQEFRQRGSSGSRLRPIESKLYHSMRSTALSRVNGGEKAPESRDVRQQVAPRANNPVGQNVELRLSPTDFVPKYEWVRRQVPGEGIMRHGKDTAVNYPNREASADNTNYYTMNQDHRMSSPTAEQPVAKLYEEIKPADYDSGTENSTDKSANGQWSQHISEERSPRAAPARESTMSSKLEPSSHPEPSMQEDPKSYKAQSDWHSIDADGETESDATDGLDQITDLTCLTSLVDTCASRHRALLANRPSALEHLLISLGWWSPSLPVDHRYYPPTAAEAISIAAHEFDVDEDSHRTEFLQLLAGPESRRPINLGEFALNHLSASVQRKREDGLMYISCGRSECPRPPSRVEQAMNWCACANCYTLYCSPTCRAMDRRMLHDHPTVCSFARAKRVCNRVLRNMTPQQLVGLTALAKTGMARLGRGGILLSFALIKHAEVFLDRCWGKQNEQNAFNCWESQHQPSPGGLMCPPLYLTLRELEELDSTVAIPCRNYTPTSGMVIIVVVCAYELIARADGRPVHLFKQSMIIPFPVNTTSMENPSRSPSMIQQKQSASVLQPSTPQPNGLHGKPDRQAQATREAYMIRLQRILRERGVSLRHHHPDIYTQLANFVETGIPFAPIQIVFHDFVLREEVVCVIQPLLDPIIQPTRTMTRAHKPDAEAPRKDTGATTRNGAARIRETQF